MNTPNIKKMSSLGLSEIPWYGEVPMGLDRISCDIMSLTPAKLRTIIDKMKPNIYEYEMKFYHHVI